MSPYSYLASRVLFPLHERFKGHDTWRIYKELNQTQWRSSAQLLSLQLHRLRDLLIHAYSESRFYRQRLDACGMRPADISSIADLARIPPLTKDDIRAHTETITSLPSQRLSKFSTTGSSGDPLQFYISKSRVSHDVAAKWRATNWWDVDIGDREFVAWSSPIELNRHDKLKTLRDVLLRSRLESATSLDDSRCDQLLEKIQRFRPAMLFGYPSALALLAQRAIVRNLGLNRIGVKVAFVTAERTFPHHRQLIRAGFGCPTANGYGGRDAGFIAHECPHGGMHVTAEDIIVEVVDSDNRPVPVGIPGEVVVTHLFSYGFPFVRYKNGDIAVLSDRHCTCGRGLPLIEDIQGRTNDFLIAESGARVHGVTFGMLMRDMQGVRSFQFVQEARKSVKVFLAVADDFDSAKEVPRIAAYVRDRLGPTVESNVQFVDRLEAEKSGKFRYVICKVTNQP